MKNDDDIAICTELRIDADLAPLLGMDGVMLQEIRCYHNWRRGYGGTDIGRYFGIRVEEAEASITHIQRLVPREMLDRDIGLRNEILEIPARSAERARRLQVLSSKSASDLMAEGRNPAKMLKELREELTAVEPSRITALRKQSIKDSTHETTSDISSEEEYKRIATLRKEDEKPAKRITTENHIKHEFPCDLPEQNRQTPNDVEQMTRKNRPDRRITFRMDPDLHEKVRQYRQDTGVELSILVRRALSQFLQADTTSKETVNAEMPQEALSLMGKYQVWGSDLREELWVQFLRTIAAAYVATRKWHRDEKSHRLYEGLIRLYQSLEADNVRQK
jgi:hypothetical protein